MDKKTELVKKESYTFDDLLAILKILRSPGGCPWDMEQTHKSIRADFIEEVYEAIEGIDSDDKKYQSSVYFMDIVSELERMGDFMINISQSLQRAYGMMK